ncbi:hydroxyisourate hydrolase [Gordonia sp. CPCC 205333]|uniref:hydroxyisourate hydrolase n=1 Tax=Gordonia sp. CPCC 205333 TaxID=3140790 RepID=UPI003AF38CBA
MSGLSTHVLDAVSGGPAVGIRVVLYGPDGSEIAVGVTDSDGRITDLSERQLAPADYLVTFATGEWFATNGIDGFYPSVDIAFTVRDESHYHVPLLLSPFAYSTYRGS